MTASSLLANVKSKLTGSRGDEIDWSLEPAEPLWFESNSPQAHIETLVQRWQSKLPDDDVRSLSTKWIKDGYVVIDDCYSPEEIDRYAAEVDNAWYASSPVNGLLISDVNDGEEVHVHMPHDKLLALPLEARQAAKDRSNWRIGEFHLYNDAAAKIFKNQRMELLCSMLMDRLALPHFSLTFSKGSRQALHQDSCVFHVWPKNALIGVWIALEDIKIESGPLVYCPGSQSEPMYGEFSNYPQTQRRTAPKDQADRYDAYVSDIATKYPKEQFLAKKGQTLLWHGMLIHGGSDFVAPGTTRKSFVIHYMPNGGNVGHRVSGPFNW
jgi:phytanoyl-CoA hydroxylase